MEIHFWSASSFPLGLDRAGQVISFGASRLSIWRRKKVYLCVGFIFKNFSFRCRVK